MIKIEVAVMESKYQVNLGHIARVSKNFGVNKLLLVKPRCNHVGKNAIKYSKHAHELLEKAKICSSIKQLDRGFIIGTTGVWHKTGESFYNLYKLDQVRSMISDSNSSDKIVTVLLGRDDTGLSKEELKQCDATVCIETNKEYPILNISHALAIILYSLTSKQISKNPSMSADSAYQKRVLNLFEMLVKNNPRIRDKKSVNMAFRHVIRRSMPTKKEINALSIALAPKQMKKR